MYSRDRAVEEAVERLVGLGLAADRRLFDLLLQAERLEARQAALRELRRQRRQLARRLEHVAALDAQPVAMKRAEDGVRLALLRADVAKLIDRVQARMVDRLDPRRLEGRAAELSALTAERADLAGEVDGFGIRLLRELDDLPLGLAVADDQARAALAKLGVELGEALQEKLRARTRRVASMKQAIVEAEDRDDALVAVERCAQRGMVADPQVATKPDDAGPASGHGWNLPADAQLKRATRATAFAGASRTSRTKKLARPRGVPAPAAVDQRLGSDSRPARQRQLALRADEGSVSDHLGPVADELALELDARARRALRPRLGPRPGRRSRAEEEPSPLE